MFKRRTKLTRWESVSHFFYPRGGWWRAVSYMIHRLRRLPDPPHRIARGVAAGVFTSFTPLFGLHFLIAAGISWAMRGNIVASLLATFVGNPITFPFIAAFSVELGAWLMGLPGGMPPMRIAEAFGNASAELWHNFLAPFNDDVMQWSRLGRFFRTVFLPYLFGGMIPGVIGGLLAYALTHPAISAYQKARIKRMRKRVERRRKAEAKATEKALAAAQERTEK